MSKGVPFRRAELTPDQKSMMQVARTAFMVSCPFFAHYFYSEMQDYPTRDVPTAATDGRRVFYNPDYLAAFKDGERVFILAHEVYHAVMRHVQRAEGYQNDGTMRGIPYDHAFMNECMDYVINAALMEADIGQFNPSWLYHPGVTGKDLCEDVYQKLWKTPPPPPPGGGGGTGEASRPSGRPPSTFGKAGKSHRGAKEDEVAKGNGGKFDNVLKPAVDPVTGEEDLPGESEFGEAIARAAAAAKAMGKMPAQFQRIVDEVLAPKVDWREHIRMKIMGKVGQGSETWDRPNRRRIVLNPAIYVPGRRGFGADTVWVVRDTSGSMGIREVAAANAEITGILQDVKPRRVMVMDCDAIVQPVIHEVRHLDEVQLKLSKAQGGGGTDFRPVFNKVAEDNIKPDVLIYITDLQGTFPSKAPVYPVIWCATTGHTAPWGDVVRIEV